MNIITQATIGTSDYHALMRSVLSYAWRKQIGYIPKIAPEQDCSLPELSLNQASRYISVFADDVWGKPIGELCFIQIDTNMCCECCQKMDYAFDTILFWHSMDETCTHCECCGDEIWHIPF